MPQPYFILSLRIHLATTPGPMRWRGSSAEHLCWRCSAVRWPWGRTGPFRRAPQRPRQVQASQVRPCTCGQGALNSDPVVRLACRFVQCTSREWTASALSRLGRRLAHSHGARHLNWTFSGQLIFGQFPRKIVPGMHIPRRKRKTAKGKSVSCAIAHTGLDYSIVNMGSAIFFSPNTHQQQHFATSFNAFRHTSSDAQNITLFFLRVPSCVGVLMPTSFTRM